MGLFCYYGLMEEEQLLIVNIKKAISSSHDQAQVAETLAKVDIPKTNGFTTNSQILADYIGEFQFARDNEAYYNEEQFVSETVAKIKQIVADIESGNRYNSIFSADLAYSQLEEGNYSYKVVAQKMSASSVDEAIKEKDEIRAKAPKQHPEDKSYTLEDVRVRVKIVDQNKNTVLEEKFLLN